jgi:acetolactate synthase-1/3 small subunit
MRHIISILLQNEAGALARVAGMFSSRGYNIDSLTVAPTHDSSVSRLSLVTTGSDAVIHQIIQQTRKLIDVVEIVDLSSRDHVEAELLLVKIAAENAEGVDALLGQFGAALLDRSGGAQTLQLVGTGVQVDAFLAQLGTAARILEVTRSGVAAMERGSAVLALPA